MDIDLLYHPHRQEEVTVTINRADDHQDLDYYQWCELMEKVEDAHVSYATWYQEEGGDVMVLEHEYDIEDGKVMRYNQELVD